LAQETGDIIVTARRVEERLQDVPISMTVFDQHQLDDRNVNSGNDLALYTPSLSANSRFGTDNASFAIRGFSQESRTTASVGIYFADVVAPRGGTASIGSGDGAGPGSFFDLQNVQVLKGPQGTLFGRNTTGGAVLLVPRKPSDLFEGYVEGSIGNYDLRRLQAVVNTPLGDQARLRIGVDRQIRDGFLKNISGIGPGDFGDLDYWALRASLVVDLTPSIENYTIVSYLHSRTNGQIPQVTVCNSAVFPQGAPICDQIARRQGQGKFAVQSAIDDPLSLMRQWQAINTTTWQLNDQITIKNIASYSQFYNRIRSDFFGVDAIVPASQTNPRTGAVVAGGALTGAHGAFNTSFTPPNGSLADQENFTEELQVQGRAMEGKLDWQVGAYMERSDPLGDNTVYAATRLICEDRFAFQCTNFPGGTGSLTIQKFRASFHNHALYGQASYRLSDQWKVTGGLRYTWDTSRAKAINAQYLFPSGAAPTGRCANPTLRPPGNPPITSITQCLDRPVQKSNAPTWLLGLDYTPSDNILIYGKYARGYRQGSVNPLAAGGFTTYEPEKVDAYEIGMKASWHGAVPGNLNIAGFYNDLSNQQIALGLTSSPARGSAPPNNAIVNIGQSRLQGVEVEAGIGPIAGLRLDASYAYIDAKLRSTVTPTFPPESPYDGFIPINPGQPAPYTPKNKLSLTGTYTLPLPERFGTMSVAATYSYVDEQVIFSTNYGTLPSYDLLNLNLNWRQVAGSPVDLSLFATNITNERYAVAVNDMETSGGFVSLQYGQPRMYGLRLRVAFGS
jgi:iron complex outermembrane receptor protein